jgi:hypothetical protein
MPIASIGFIVVAFLTSSEVVAAPARDCWAANEREVAYGHGTGGAGTLYVCRKNASVYQWEAINAKLNIPASAASRIPSVVVGKDELAAGTSLTIDDISLSGKPGELMVGLDGGRIGWEKHPFVPASTQTIALDSVAGAQSRIDSAMRFIPAGVTLTFAITGTLTESLQFKGFFGSGKVVITGGTIQHSGEQSAIILENCQVSFEIRSLTTVAASGATAQPISLSKVSFLPHISNVNLTRIDGNSDLWAIKTDAVSYAVLAPAAGNTINFKLPTAGSVADATASHIARE